MIVVWSGWGALRYRLTGVDEGLRTGLESLWPADSDDADGTGEVSKQYPQVVGTRPSQTFSIH
jgi:hypothetical protein